MPKVLPPGVSASAFTAAVAALRAAVGQGFVLTDTVALGAYRDPYSLFWGEAEEYLASAAVLPASVEEVQAIVRIANQYRLPLYPISTGKNLTYGSAAPTLSGSVVVDLKRMNRILRVDEARAFALVEPGVTYLDLYQHVQDRGLKLWLDVPDPGWGSLVGNALDHGVGYTAGPYRDHFGSHCGMEVVLANGEVMRTGMGALPNADSWQDYRYGVGPYVDGLFAQANFGIVTKMGFWLMPQPEAWLTGFVSCQHYDDFPAMVEAINHLEDAGISTGKPVWTCTPYHPFEGNLPSAEPRPSVETLMAHGWPSMDAIIRHAKQHGGHAWRVNLQFYGPQKTVEASWEYACDYVLNAVPESTHQYVETLTFPLTAEQQKRLKLANFGTPNLSILNRSAAQVESEELHAPVQGHVDFLAVVPRTAEALMRAQKVLHDSQVEVTGRWATTPYNAPLCWYHRTFLIGAPVVSLFHGEPEANRKARRLYETYVKNMGAAGFGVYRTNPAMQDLAVSQYGFGDHALQRFQQVLKDAVDPNGILAPGRYGLWPKGFKKAVAR